MAFSVIFVPRQDAEFDVSLDEFREIFAITEQVHDEIPFFWAGDISCAVLRAVAAHLQRQFPINGIQHRLGIILFIPREEITLVHGLQYRGPISLRENDLETADLLFDRDLLANQLSLPKGHGVSGRPRRPRIRLTVFGNDETGNAIQQRGHGLPASLQ